MNPRSVDALTSVIKPNQPGNGAGRTFFKALLVMSTLLSGGLIQSADAHLWITAMGTVTTGSKTGDLFSLPTATTRLVGDSYTPDGQLQRSESKLL